MFVLFLHLPDSTLSYTETVPPLLSSPPHITPRDYTGEKLASRLQKYMNNVTRQMFVSAAYDVESWFEEGTFPPANKFGSTNGKKFLSCMSVCVHVQTHSCMQTSTACILSECLHKRVNYIYCCYFVVLSLLFSKTVKTTKNSTA